MQKEILPLLSTTATLTVSFNSGVGSLDATLHRQDGSSDSTSFDSNGGEFSFEDVNPGDSIAVHSIAAADVDLTIHRQTDPATPINLKGEKNIPFNILT